jgi:hypothetical protein
MPVTHTSTKTMRRRFGLVLLGAAALAAGFSTVNLGSETNSTVQTETGSQHIIDGPTHADIWGPTGEAASLNVAIIDRPTHADIWGTSTTAPTTIIDGPTHADIWGPTGEASCVGC